jgi:hypothetical protein
MTVSELVERSAAQRAAIIASARPLLRVAAVPDRALATFRRHPLPIAAGVAAFALLGGRRVLSLASRALTLYMLFRR